MNFTVRSNESELIDRDDLSFEEIRRNMLELEVINSRLGGHRITINGLQSLLHQTKLPKRPLVICEIGCGGGDNITALSKWCKKNRYEISFIGVDINPNCIRYARERNKIPDITFIENDYKNVFFVKKPDIIFSSLFCHHFPNPQLKEMLQWLRNQSEIGFFINDLHRHPLAYYSIRLLTLIFSKSRLVKNDAPLSVLKGFHKNEWRDLLRESNIKGYSIQWQWAFRWLIVVKNIQPALH